MSILHVQARTCAVSTNCSKNSNPMDFGTCKPEALTTASDIVIKKTKRRNV
jgi:hypothetical protein